SLIRIYGLKIFISTKGYLNELVQKGTISRNSSSGRTLCGSFATLACLVLGYPFAWFLAKLPHKVRPLLLFLLIVPFWTNSLIRIYGLKIFLSTKGYLNELVQKGTISRNSSSGRTLCCSFA
ncbi:hypothetical protein QJN73_25020, partial [Escherichia coli]